MPFLDCCAIILKFTIHSPNLIFYYYDRSSLTSHFITIYFTYRRRKSLPSFVSDYQRSHATLPPNSQPKRYVGNVNPAIDCATPTHLSHTLGPIKPRQVLYEGQAVTSLMTNGHTMTRCLANHYIPDRMLTLDTRHPAEIRDFGDFDASSTNNDLRKQVQEDFRQRFEVRRNVMELSERPPMPVPTSVYQMADYPHIVIGGKPFFLIPSSNASSIVNPADQSTQSSEAYAYPQHMPIYEEIDYNAIVNTNNSAHGSAVNSNSKVVMDRPLSSTASQSNSAHTNTSELSSNESHSSQHDTSTHHGLHSAALIMTPTQKRLTDHSSSGVERSRSPQSIYSAKLATSSQKSGQSSVYYYSDTLKPRTYANTSMESDDSIDVTKKVNTKVTLDDPHTQQSGSTLV